MENKRDFKGIWIPKEVWLDKRLNAIDKMILAEINSLDCEDGCFATNEYLADFCQCSQSQVTKSISKLKECGYIYLKSFDGRTRVLGCVVENRRQTNKIYEADSENLGQSNIIENNNIIKKENYIKEKKDKVDKKEISEDWEPKEETKRKLEERGIDWQKAKEIFILGCQAKGYKYKNFDAAFLKWDWNKEFDRVKKPEEHKYWL